MLWYAYATIQIHIILVWKVGGQKPTWSSPCDLIASSWWPLWAMKSNLNLVLPFVILIMRHWNSQDAVIFMQGSKHTQSWFGKWGGSKSNLVLTCDSIASTWWTLWAMKSNLNLVLPFIQKPTWIPSKTEWPAPADQCGQIVVFVNLIQYQKI